MSKASLQSGFMQSGAEVYKLADSTYRQMHEHILDPTKPEENSKIMNTFNEVNPNLYRTENALYYKSADKQPAAKRATPLTEEMLEQLRTKKIEDE